MEKEKALCIMMSEDYDDDQDKFIYRNISELRLIEDYIKNNHYLYFVTDNDEYEIETFEMKWFRYVPSNSHMAAYFDNNECYECEWTEQGEKIG